MDVDADEENTFEIEIDCDTYFSYFFFFVCDQIGDIAFIFEKLSVRVIGDFALRDEKMERQELPRVIKSYRQSPTSDHINSD